MASPTLYREFTTQAQIDAQYNPSAGLADSSSYAQHYVERSRLARDSLPCVLEEDEYRCVRRRRRKDVQRLV